MAKKAKKTARGRALDRRLVSGQQKYEADYEARYGRTRVMRSSRQKEGRQQPEEGPQVPVPLIS